MSKELKPAYTRYATAETERSLSERISLPWFEGMQDWDLIAADSGRVSEFLKIYQNGDLNDDERFALMQLIVASLDDSIDESNDFEQNDSWIKCKTILTNEFWLHISTIHYWSLLEKDVNEGFPITRHIRPIWEDLKSHFL